MTNEDKELLLKDISARLPYGVKIAMPGLWDNKITIEPLTEIFKGDDGLFRVNGNGHCIEYIKPYLFPFSSMTEEQKSFFEDKHIEADEYLGIIGLFSQIDIKEWDEVFHWLNKNHFDYRGLIDKSLALDATNLNIY